MTTVEPFASPGKTVPDVESKIKRDRWGRYVIPDPVTGKERSWTRATTHAKLISDTFMLNQWSERMVAKGLASRPDLAARVLSTDDRSELQNICTEAKTAAGSKIGANMGTALHGFTEMIDRGEEIRSLPPVLRTAVESYSAALRDNHLVAVREYIEAVIICPELGIAGRLDRVLTNTAAIGKWTEPGALIIGDVKTAANIGYSWLEVSMQLAIYAHGSAIWDPNTETFLPMPVVDQTEAIVMHMPVPSEGNAGYTDLYRVNIESGWEYALFAAKIRDARKDKGLAARLGSPITDRPIPANLIPEGVDWKARIDEATCRADLSAIWTEASSRGLWTTELEAYGLDRAKDLRG